MKTIVAAGLVCCIVAGAASPLAKEAAPPRLHAWTIAAEVEVARIESIALKGATRVTGYILKRPSIADRKNRYFLYEADPTRGPRLLAASDFLADLAWNPHSGGWTVRGDFGKGVQIYAIDGSHVRPLVVNPQTVSVGGGEGVLPNAVLGPRPTGVLSYGWSPDGSRLWYVKLRLKSAAERQRIEDRGITYDGAVVAGVGTGQTALAATVDGLELRLVEGGRDRLLDFQSLEVAMGGGYFHIGWPDGDHLQFQESVAEGGPMEWQIWRVDVRDGSRVRVPTAAFLDVESVPTPEGFLTVRNVGGKGHLQNIALSGAVVKDYGETDLSYLDPDHFAHTPDYGSFVAEASLPDRVTLTASHLDRLSATLAGITDNMSTCAFNSDLSAGACVRESLTLPPQLVLLSVRDGAVSVLAKPNARYETIAPLRSVAAAWTNKYGGRSEGYVTYPRDYVKGRSYPAIVVSHGGDAKNRFALDWLQWEFPIQVMAERGYFVLSVREPKFDPSVPPPYFPGGIAAGVQKQQAVLLNEAASMEVAPQALIASGDIDPHAVGIAGYSHGAETLTVAIGQSNTFAAASTGDDPGYVAGGYWGGGAFARTWWTGVFGGSPLDPANLPNYRNLALDARTDRIRTPLLQGKAGTQSPAEFLEAYEAFAAAHIPTELYYYPAESHVIYEPHHRASAMARNLDWFDYWMLGRRDPDPAKAAQYARWDAMALAWPNCDAACRTKLGLKDSSPVP
ncbi:MAG: prolyl oligopeptidase family serine peptidase [Rhizomicrobium sp.]